MGHYCNGLYLFRRTIKTLGNRIDTTISTWQELKLAHVDPADIAFDNDKRFPILLASDGGMQTTSDSGANWHLTGGGQNGFNALQITDVTGQRVKGASPHYDLYFGTQDNHIWASSDGGVTWPYEKGGEGFQIQTDRESYNHIGSKVVGVIVGIPRFISDQHYEKKRDFNHPTDSDTSDDGNDGVPVYLNQQGYYLHKTVNIDSEPNDIWFHLTTDTGTTWTRKFQIKEEVAPGLLQISGPISDPTLYIPFFSTQYPGNNLPRKVGLKKNYKFVYRSSCRY